MPTERRGTVTDDLEAYIKRIKNSAEWKADRAGNIRMPVARVCSHIHYFAIYIELVFHLTDGFPYPGCCYKFPLCDGFDKKGHWER